MDLTHVTIIESIYLLYMYFIFKTTYNFSFAPFDKETQSLGYFFIHSTSSSYENKICIFGKFMAVVAVILAFARLSMIKYNDKQLIINGTVTFDVVCIILAVMMNLNAFIYILPLIVGEIYVINNL